MADKDSYKYRIAIASSDGETVNRHYGRADKFFIYLVDDEEGFNWAMMRAALGSVADTCILMMADLLGLSSEARINTPSTLGNNWQWRIADGCINDWLASILRENTELYCRIKED